MTVLTIIAPSDPQLRTTAMCEERGLEPPQVIASKQEASDIIGAILRREYEPDDYVYPFGWERDLPF